jgi:hypothetical protein
VADNIAITAGSGTTVATDDVSGVHFQRVKLVDGTLDGSGALGGVDDAAFTPGTSCVIPAGFTLDDTTTDLVNEGDQGAARMTADRKQIVVQGEGPANLLNGTGSATNTNDTALIAAQGSGVFIYVTTIIIHNSSATDTYCTIKDGSTAKLVLPAPAKGGAVVSLPVPLRISDNAALNFASAASVTTMYASAIGYKATA